MEASDSSSPNCSICLCQINRKCFADPCLHEFCFDCLLKWSKIKADCPLCKRTFKSIIHNVKSMDNYEEYKVESCVSISVTSSDNRIEEVLSLVRARIHRQRVSQFNTAASAYRTLTTIRRMQRPRLLIRSYLPNVTEEISYMTNESISSNHSRSVIMYSSSVEEIRNQSSTITTGELVAGSNPINVATMMQASDSGLHRSGIRQRLFENKRLIQKSDDGGWSCVKILFFSLMAVLGLIVLIILKSRLVSVDTAAVPL